MNAARLVSVLLEDGGDDPKDYLLSVPQDPNQEMPCHERCVHCGQPCTFIHRRSDPFEHEHICQLCDVNRFNDMLDRM